MVHEVLAHLAVDAQSEGLVIDGTVGMGGHTEALLAAAPALRVLGMDRDAEALEIARARLARHAERVTLVRGSYASLDQVLTAHGLSAPRGVLLDVGLSSYQLDHPERGFAFRFPDAALDMRFDASPGKDTRTAAWFVNHASERELADLIFHHGDERRSRAIARAIVRARPIQTVGALAAIVRRHAQASRRIDGATKTFQALRIAVNDELGHFERGLRVALRALAHGGRLVVLAFHSKEERLVKAAFQAATQDGLGHRLTKKPLRPSEAECARNPRARSARLRAFERSP